MLVQQLARYLLDRVALANQVPRLRDNEAEHGDSWGIRRNGRAIFTATPSRSRPQLPKKHSGWHECLL